MNENTLLKISLVISLLGILVLLFITENLDYPLTKISDIDKGKIDEKIKVEGEILSFRTAQNVSFIELQDNSGSITVIVFEEIPLENNQKTTIIGTVSEYEGSLEILADEITVK